MRYYKDNYVLLRYDEKKNIFLLIQWCNLVIWIFTLDNLSHVRSKKRKRKIEGEANENRESVILFI